MPVFSWKELPEGHPFKGAHVFFKPKPQNSSKNTQNSTELERQYLEKYKDKLMSPEEGEALLKRMHFGEVQVTFVRKRPVPQEENSTEQSPKKGLVQALKAQGIRVKVFLKEALHRK